MAARGQLTILIIVGLLVLIMVGIVLYAARSATVKQGDQRVQTQQRTAALLKPVQDYVTQCLDLSARSTLELLGQQGGVIYASQGGATPDPFQSGVDYLADGQTKVRYGILLPQGNVGTVFFSQAPEYPWGAFPQILNDTPPHTVLLADYLQGYYGINNLPPLERPDKDAVQEQLETAGLAKLSACLDWKVFASQGVTVSSGTPSLRVVFGAHSTSFLLYDPLDLTSTIDGTQAHIDSFATDVPVRMKSIFDTARTVIDKDATDITFDPSAALVNGIEVSVARDMNLHDDEVRFTDPLSKIGGVQYIFQTARKNRAPALVWVSNTTVNAARLCDGSTVNAQGPLLTGSIASCAGSFSAFSWTMQAYDPDEDNLTFSYAAGPGHAPVPQAYTVTGSDASYGLLALTITVSDQELTDWQDVLVPAAFTPQP
jgi:hypothetical protein